LGAEAGVAGSREGTRQPRTYPQIVHEFSDFLRATIRSVSALDEIATPSVAVILDELDKIVSPDETQDFVNEVKALFNLGRFWPRNFGAYVDSDSRLRSWPSATMVSNARLDLLEPDNPVNTIRLCRGRLASTPRGLCGRPCPVCHDKRPDTGPSIRA
jgi:hypothetical protein